MMPVVSSVSKQVRGLVVCRGMFMNGPGLRAFGRRGACSVGRGACCSAFRHVVSFHTPVGF